jgi:tetratricopeptide (TPR) repeat protein
VNRLPPLWLLIVWGALLFAVWPVLRNAQGPADAKAGAAATALNADAISQIRASQWNRGIDSAQRALLAKPDYEPAWQSLRWLLAAKVRAKPTPEFYQEQAMGLYQAGRYRECIDSAKRAIGLYPEYTKAFNLMSVCYMNLGMYDDAVAAAREAVRIEPDFQLARNNLNLALQRKATGAAPAQATADNLLNASVLDYRNGRMQACVDDARAALRLNPGLAVAYNNIAACSNDLGRPDDAIAAAAEALRLQPDFQLARNNLAVAQNLKSKRK